jgi:hypothetical protein
MNLPLGSRVIIDRTNEPNHAPGDLVMLLEAPGLEIEARHNEPSGDYIMHGSVVRGRKDYYTFAVRRVPRLSGVRAMAASLARTGTAMKTITAVASRLSTSVRNLMRPVVFYFWQEQELCKERFYFACCAPSSPSRRFR